MSLRGLGSFLITDTSSARSALSLRGTWNNPAKICLQLSSDSFSGKAMEITRKFSCVMWYSKYRNVTYVTFRKVQEFGQRFSTLLENLNFAEIFELILLSLSSKSSSGYGYKNFYFGLVNGWFISYVQERVRINGYVDSPRWSTSLVLSCHPTSRFWHQPASVRLCSKPSG